MKWPLGSKDWLKVWKDCLFMTWQVAPQSTSNLLILLFIVVVHVFVVKGNCDKAHVEVDFFCKQTASI